MFRSWLKISLLLLPVLVRAQVRHWQVPNGDVYLQADFTPGGPNLHFERAAPPELTSTLATIIGQDSSGFVWLASRHEYILRYDGQHFEKFQTPKNMASTRHVIDASTNSIWLATFKGLCCFDMANGEYQLFKNESSPTNGIFERIYFDPQRQVLLCCINQGIFEFSLAEQRFIRRLDGTMRNAYTGEVVEGGFPSFAVDLKTDIDGNYWMASLVRGSWELAMVRPETGEATFFPWSVQFSPGIVANNKEVATCYSLYFDPDGQHIWVAGVGGLKRFHKQTWRWEQYFLNKPEHDFTTNQLYDVLPWGERYLALTSHVGLHLFDKHTGQFHNYQFFEKKLGSHWSHIVHQPLLDRDGNLWVLAGLSGFYRLDPRKQLFNKPENLPDDFSPSQVFVDTAKQATWLLGIDYDSRKLNGYKFDHRRGVGRRFTLPFCHASFLPDPARNQAWLSAQNFGCQSVEGSIWLLDLATLQCRPVRLPVQGLPPGITTDSLGECRLSRAPNGDTWIGSQRFGLLRYDSSTGKVEQVLPGNGSDSLSVAQLLADSKGQVWFVPNGGQTVHCLNPSSGVLRSFPLPPTVKQGWNTLSDNMVETADGQIWTAIDRHLYRLPGKESDVNFEEVPDIFPSINYLATDEQGNLWCNTRDGLAAYNCAVGRWKILTTKDGLPESPGDEAVSNCAADRMYLTGATWFQPSALRFNEAVAVPVFTGLRVREKQMAEGRFLHVTRRINLRPGEDALTIEFAATSFTNPEDNVFAYRLSGMNDDWVEVGNRHAATFTNLNPGHYRFELKAANSDGFWNEKPAGLDIYLAPFFYQTTWFKWLAAAALLVIGYLFYQNRLNAARRESLLKQKDAALKQQQAEFKQQLLELETAALRSQMNPHFIFNVLNSINYFLAANGAEVASEYLMKFSRLVRLVLDNSSQKTVSLHNDLAALHLYLEMESLRFGGKLKFSLDVSPEIDQKYLRLPPMLIQPYVENAIWHGLMQKKGGGSVEVRVQQVHEQLLRVEVEDDGIGRAAAMALKSKSATDRKSYGMDITARRLALLNDPEHPTMHIQVEDLHDTNGQATGTRVVLEIPV